MFIARCLPTGLIDLGEYFPERYYLKEDIAVFDLGRGWVLIVRIRSLLFQTIWSNLNDVERQHVKFRRLESAQ